MAVHRRLPKPPASAVSKSTVLVDIEGERVKIIGRIEIHKGKPEIRINAAPERLPMVPTQAFSR
jgi:hypothetical protein